MGAMGYTISDTKNTCMLSLIETVDSLCLVEEYEYESKNTNILYYSAVEIVYTRNEDKCRFQPTCTLMFIYLTRLYM